MAELQNMCRACASEIEIQADLHTFSAFKDNSPMDVMLYLFPELKLPSTKIGNYKLCLECIDRLLECRLFKQMVVETEKQMKKYFTELELILTDGKKNVCPKIQRVMKEINRIHCNDCPDSDESESDQYKIDYEPNFSTLKTRKTYSKQQSLIPAPGRNSDIRSRVSNKFKQITEKLESTFKVGEENVNNRYQVKIKALKEIFIGENTETFMSPYEKLRATFDTEKTSYTECNVLVVLDPVVKFAFGCDKCGEIFSKKRLLAEHLTFHDKVRRGVSGLYECETCNESFDHIIIFKKHEKFCITESLWQRFQCRYCDEWHHYVSTFKEHERNCFKRQQTAVKQQTAYLCSICGKTFQTFWSCHHHEQLHSAPNRNENSCNICSKQFISKPSLDKHIAARHMNINKNSCHFCSKQFISKPSLDKHIAARHISCTVCDDVLSSKEKFERHMHQVHGVKLHECEVCKKRFAHKELMMSHMRDVHSGSRFVCEICGNVFKTRMIVQDHVNTVHATDRKLFKCLHCEREFKTATQRKCHTIRVHEPEKMLQCEQCPMRQPIQCLLTRHVNRAHKHMRKVCTCKICGTTLSGRSQFRRHTKIHERENVSRSCKHCGETFADAIFYRVHMRQLHKDKLSHCTLCPAAFSNKVTLTKHMRLMHRADDAVDRQREPPVACSECGETFIRKTTCSYDLCEKCFDTASL